MDEKIIIEKNKKISVGGNGLYLGDDNILYETIIGEIDEKKAISIIEATQKLEDLVDGKVNFFVDINRAKKQSSEARILFKERAEKSDKIGKVAVYGLHPVAQVIASFVMTVTRKKDIHFFKSKEKAIAWLKE